MRSTDSRGAACGLKRTAPVQPDKLRYPSDLTDEEWSHIEPLIPPAKRGGRDREVDVREVVNASCMC